MKKVSCALLAGCLLLLCACGAPAPNTPPQKVPELLRVMAPSQGGEMLYPVYYRAQKAEMEPDAEAPLEFTVDPNIFTLMGLINQNGERVTPAQFVGASYYKDANGREQYLFATTVDERCTVYTLDGSIYDEFPAQRIRQAVQGVPQVIVLIESFPGSTDGQIENVYSIAEKKWLFENVYTEIQFVDRHTLHLIWTVPVEGQMWYRAEDRREALYDMDTGKITPLPGFLALELSEELLEHITHLPAIREYSWEKTEPEGYVSREGVWTETLPQGAALPKAMTQAERERYFVSRKEKVVGGLYKWKESLDYQGYVDEAGEWVWREARQYAFLED